MAASDIIRGLEFWRPPYAVSSINNYDLKFVLYRNGELARQLQSSTLRSLLPSQIDFTQHCRALRALQSVSFSGIPFQGPLWVGRVGAHFRHILAPQYQEVDVTLIAFYWRYLEVLDQYTAGYNDDAVGFLINVYLGSCEPTMHQYDPQEQRQKWYAQISVADIGLTTPSHDMVKIWDNYLNPLRLGRDNYIIPSTNQSLIGPSFRATTLFRSLLPEEHRQSDDIEVGYVLAKSTLDSELANT